MNRGALLVGLGGGLVSAVLLLSAAQGSLGGRLILFFLGPLPLFLAGLGWGTPAAVIAALTGAAAAGSLLGPWPGLIYLLTQGAPAVLIAHLALKRYEPLAAEPDGAAAADVTWYPLGHLITAIALLSGGLAAGSFAIVGWDVDELRQGMRQFIEQMLQRQLPGLEAGKMTPEEITTFANLLVARLPAAMALMWFLTLILNLWIAGRISLASGRLARAWPELSQFQLPATMALALAVSLAVTMVPGLPRLLANAVSTACLAAYVLQGLAIVHHVTRGQAWRGFLLSGVYAALLVTGAWGAYAIALIGLAEPISPLNRNTPPARPV